jgi:hypothetical protein
VKAANLLLRFLLELCALTALGWWGAHTGSRTLTKIALATVVVLAAAVAWALIVAPNAPVDGGPLLRWAVELAVFGAATAALVAVGHPQYAVALALVYVANRALMATWDQ